MTQRQPELLERLRIDPVSAGPAVYARFAPVVNRVVRRLLGTDPDEDDIVQQVVYRIFREIEHIREPEKIDSWVRVVAANTAFELLRSRQARRRLTEHYTTETYADLVRQVETRDLLLRLQAALERLPAAERILFVRHYVEGRTLAELAELAGCSLATTKRKVRRANRHLRVVLAPNRELLRLVRGEQRRNRE